MHRIYVDHAATTPLSPRAREAMLPWLDAGNPSSLYTEGRRAKDAIDQARETLSRAFNCLFAEVVFTSGGTEAANLAIVGTALANQQLERRRILIGAAEHHCVLHTRPILEKLGYQVEAVPVGRDTRINLEALQRMVGDDVLLASLMHANNETGAINDGESIAAILAARGILYHCDAVQSFLSEAFPPADLVSVSAHKLNGPKGAGALRVRAGTRVKPLIAGGGQERELRAGTENVAAIVGFAAAVEERLSGVADNRGTARASFLSALDQDYVLTLPPFTPCLAGHLHLRFPGISAESMLIVLDRLGVAASSGAACSAGSIEPSHVLLAAGYSVTEAKEGLRFTFGHQTTNEEATQAAYRVNQARKGIVNPHP